MQQHFNGRGWPVGSVDSRGWSSAVNVMFIRHRTRSKMRSMLEGTARHEEPLR